LVVRSRSFGGAAGKALLLVLKPHLLQEKIGYELSQTRVFELQLRYPGEPSGLRCVSNGGFQMR
jgi:hypothetical protein